MTNTVKPEDAHGEKFAENMGAVDNQCMRRGDREARTSLNMNRSVYALLDLAYESLTWATLYALPVSTYLELEPLDPATTDRWASMTTDHECEERSLRTHIINAPRR